MMSLVERMDRARFRSVLCCIEHEAPWARDVEGFCDDVVVMPKEPGFAIGLPLRLARYLRGRGVGLVHCHNFGAFVYGALAGRLASCRGILYTAHGPDFPCEKRRRLFQRLPLADHIIAVSEKVRRSAVERVGIPPERVTTIVNGIDVRGFSASAQGPKVRSELGAKADTPLVGSVARLSWEKDHETLFRAFSRLLPEHPDVRLLVVGDGPLRRSLEERVRDLALGDAVQFLGTRRDVPDVLAALNVFVLASREEGLPVALLEAMAAGLPVVATSVGGIPDVVVDGETGLLVPPGDPARLSEAIFRLMNNGEEARAMGREASKRVAERFDVSRMVRAYEDVYLRVLGGNR